MRTPHFPTHGALDPICPPTRSGADPDTRGANQQILTIIHQYADFHKHLDALHEAWQFDTFIHGDMKWENCIVYPMNGEPQVKIVDWETADFGDACWDCGGHLSGLPDLLDHVDAYPGENRRRSSMCRELPFPLRSCSPPSGLSGWHMFARGRSPRRSRPSMLQRSMGYGAARMLQTAFEYMYYSPQITANALSCCRSVSIS